MLSEQRIKEVMREKHCDYRTACSWLGKMGARAKVARKRQAERKALLERRADEQFARIKASRPDLY